jgi:single-strand DNA-binding protein
MNKIMLIGNLGRDPDMTYTQSGMAITKFTLAVNRLTKSSATGERQKETDWFNIVAMNKLAEICNEYLHKGSKVFIEGRLSQRKYTDKNGIERWMVEVIVNDMEMLTPKSAQTSSSDFMAGNIDDLGDLEDHGGMDEAPF